MCFLANCKYFLIIDGSNIGDFNFYISFYSFSEKDEYFTYYYSSSSSSSPYIPKLRIVSLISLDFLGVSIYLCFKKFGRF